MDVYEIESMKCPAGDQTFEFCSIGYEGHSCDGLMNTCFATWFIDGPCSADSETGCPYSQRFDAIST